MRVVNAARRHPVLAGFVAFLLVAFTPVAHRLRIHRRTQSRTSCNILIEDPGRILRHRRSPPHPLGHPNRFDRDCFYGSRNINGSESGRDFADIAPVVAGRLEADGWTVVRAYNETPSPYSDEQFDAPFISAAKDDNWLGAWYYGHIATLVSRAGPCVEGIPDIGDLIIVSDFETCSYDDALARNCDNICDETMLEAGECEDMTLFDTGLPDIGAILAEDG